MTTYPFFVLYINHECTQNTFNKMPKMTQSTALKIFHSKSNMREIAVLLNQLFHRLPIQVMLVTVN